MTLDQSAIEAAQFIGGVLGREDARHGEPRAEVAGVKRDPLRGLSKPAKVFVICAGIVLIIVFGLAVYATLFLEGPISVALGAIFIISFGVAIVWAQLSSTLGWREASKWDGRPGETAWPQRKPSSNESVARNETQTPTTARAQTDALVTRASGEVEDVVPGCIEALKGVVRCDGGERIAFARN